MRETMTKNCDAIIAEVQNLRAAINGAQFVPEGLGLLVQKLEERAVADLKVLQRLLVLKS